ncbi:MAG: hypothetical protein ACYTGN_18630 [Planctomycetota bacterium]|jgi:hypothetical protein
MTPRIENEIRTALLPGAPDDDTRAAWARAALERAPARPRRGRLRLLWPALAAATLLTAFFWPRTEQERPAVTLGNDPEEDEAAKRLKSTSVAEQRAANVKFLKDSDERGTTDNARKGDCIIVTGGDSLHIAKSVEDAVAWADKLYPEAKHRFLFRILNVMPPRGDIIVDRTRVALGSAGTWFLNSVGLKETEAKQLTLEVGGKTVTLRVDKESAAPLILPAGMTFPRFEVPGRVIIEDLDRNWRSFRRYLVRVKIESLKFDRWVDVVGAESADKYAPGNWLAVRLGSHVFHALRKDPVEQAAEEGKPLLVLRFKEGTTAYLNQLFGGVEIGDLAQLAVPQAKRTVIMRYDRKGKLVAELPLPDAGAETAKKLRAFLR